MSKMFRRFFTRSRDVKKGFRNVWELRKHLADNPPESCGRWGWIVRSLPEDRPSAGRLYRLRLPIIY